jgi:hypothetical protein
MSLHEFLKLLGLCKENENGLPEQTPATNMMGGGVKHGVVRYLIDKTDRYAIEFRPQPDGTIKLFAVTHPADPFGAGVSINHLYGSGEICVATGRAPRTMDRARAIAMVWAKGWSTYIRTGKFPSGNQKVNVPER